MMDLIQTFFFIQTCELKIFKTYSSPLPKKDEELLLQVYVLNLNMTR